MPKYRRGKVIVKYIGVKTYVIQWGFFFSPVSLFVYDCVYVSEGKRERETEKRRHGCHSNCVIMLVAIMKAMKTGKGRGLAQKKGEERKILRH